MRRRNSEFGMRSAEARGYGPQRRFRAHPFRNPQSELRNALTLIELLITIAIIATLTAMFLGASRAAMESSRAARTKSTIDKLHTLLMEQWASYETRRVDTKGLGLPHADEQLLGRRELMKFEMPDRWSDVTGKVTRKPDDSDVVVPLVDDHQDLVLVLNDLPTLAKIYRRRFLDVNPSDRFEGAECLYMIVMYACGDGEARTMFSSRDIGDVDEDGAPEFLDGWGNPINFVRWPAGFVNASAVMSGDMESDHDPFDPFRRDVDRTQTGFATATPSAVSEFNDGFGAFRLVPLIFSNGPDGASGVLTPGDKYVGRFPGNTDPTTHLYARLDPYAPLFSNEEGVTNQQHAYVGGFDGRGSDHIDNIHNHMLDR